MKARALTLAIVAGLIVGALPAQACLPAPIPSNRKQAEQNERRRFRIADDLAEVVGLPSSRARIVRSYKGTLRSGDVIEISATPHPCLIQIAPGQRVLVYLTKIDPFGVHPLWQTSFYLNREQVSLLKSSGLLRRRR